MRRLPAPPAAALRFAAGLSAVACTAALIGLGAGPTPARAEDQPFADLYTPYLDARGESELSFSTQASRAAAGGEGATWRSRLELEHAFSDRFSGALYMNYRQEGSLGAPLRFDGPSLEAILRLAEPGRLPVDPAAYLEVRSNGDETELEPRLLLARRIRGVTAALNAAGEFEFRGDEEPGEGEERRVQLGFGAAGALGRAWRLGFEGRVEQALVESAADPRALFAGPSVALTTGEVRWVAAWQPRLAGAAGSRNDLDPGDFPRSQFRITAGVDL